MQCQRISSLRIAVACHSSAITALCYAAASPRLATPVPYASKPLHCVPLLCNAMPKHFLSLPVPVHALPSHITSMPCQALPFQCSSVPCYAPASLFMASPELLISAPCHCVSFPQLRKTKPLLFHALPGRSFSIPRLLCAHPCHDRAMHCLRVATQSQSSSQHCPSVPKLWIASLCLSTAGQLLSKQFLSFALLIPSPALASYAVPLRYSAELYCAVSQQVKTTPKLCFSSPSYAPAHLG